MKDFKSWIKNHRRILLAIVIYLIARATIFNNDVSVYTNSMSPAISQGSLAYYEKIPFEQLKVDDIIIFNVASHGSSPMIEIHRIYNITNEGLVTKGDNYNVSDEGVWGLITPDKILGKVTFVIPLLGYVFIIPSYVVGVPLNDVVASLILLIIFYVLSYLIFLIYDKSRGKKK